MAALASLLLCDRKQLGGRPEGTVIMELAPPTAVLHVTWPWWVTLWFSWWLTEVLRQLCDPTPNKPLNRLNKRRSKNCPPQVSSPLLQDPPANQTRPALHSLRPRGLPQMKMDGCRAFNLTTP